MVITALFIFPLISSLAMILFSFFHANRAKKYAFVLCLIPLAILLTNHNHLIGQTINTPWIASLGIAFHLSIDSLSLLFIYLTAIIIPIAIIAPSNQPGQSYYALTLFLQALLIGFFTARDLFLFTLFWEAILIPLYFIITLWGGTHRKTAAFKFLIYMIAGSSLMIIAVLALYFATAATKGVGTFSIDAISSISDSMPYAALIGAIFVLAFAVKTPLFPFHAWLPDAYYEASTGGTILLAGLLSKAGIYGFLRITWEFFPTIMQKWSMTLLAFAIAGVLYAALAAWRQSDFKRLIAYSSLSHINFVLAGVFLWNQMSQSGAILQAINHGVTITALFLSAGWLEERLGSTSMAQARGLAKSIPTLCWLTLFLFYHPWLFQD